MNDKININSTKAGSMNDKIIMDSTVAGSINATQTWTVQQQCQRMTTKT